MTHQRRRPAVSVHLPARQRRVLEAFFAGHLPAGRLVRALAEAAELDTAELELRLGEAGRATPPARRFRRAVA